MIDSGVVIAVIGAGPATGSSGRISMLGLVAIAVTEAFGSSFFRMFIGRGLRGDGGVD
jgi:hypothetical protein